MSSLLVDIDRLATYDAEGVAPYIIGKKETSTSPYTFRQGLGTMADMEIVGGTVAWNQLVYTNDSGTLEIGGARTRNVGVNSKHPIVSHVYYISANISSDTTVDGLYFQYGSSVMTIGKGTGRKGRIYKANNNDLSYIYMFIVSSEVSGASLTYENVKLFDLTAIFGSTIADYIYSLEQANEGDGVAFFRKYFPKDYYAYDAGSLKSVEGLQSRDVSGKNLFNPANPYRGQSASNTTSYSNNILTIQGSWYHVWICDVEPNTDYTFTRMTLASSISTDCLICGIKLNGDENPSDVILRATCSINETKSMKFNSGNRNKIAILLYSGGTNSGTTVITNLQLEYGSTATAYEPYRRYSYPLDSSLTLRGIPKLDSNNKLYYDGDVYKSDGSVERKYGIVDLGTLTWTSAANNVWYTEIINNAKAGVNGVVPNILCSVYVTDTPDHVINGTNDKTISIYNSRRIAVVDSAYSDVATFTAAMSGVMLVYELTTPTTESAQPYQNPQRAFSDGTEGFTMTGIVPVGNNTTYQLSKGLIPAEDYVDGVVEILEDGIETKVDILAIAPNEPETTASQAYSTGDHFYKDGKFCTAITSISSGATFTKNTNYREEDGGATSAMNNYRSKKLTATVSSTSLAFTDTLISNSATVIDGPYIEDVMVGVTAATISSNTVTFTLDSSSANGKSAYIWLRY